MLEILKKGTSKFGSWYFGIITYDNLSFKGFIKCKEELEEKKSYQPKNAKIYTNAVGSLIIYVEL